MPAARDYGETLRHKAMAYANDSCHTEVTDSEALGDHEEVDDAYATDRRSGLDPRRQRIQRGGGGSVPARLPGCPRGYPPRPRCPAIGRGPPESTARS